MSIFFPLNTLNFFPVKTKSNPSSPRSFPIFAYHWSQWERGETQKRNLTLALKVVPPAARAMVVLGARTTNSQCLNSLMMTCGLRMNPAKPSPNSELKALARNPYIIVNPLTNTFFLSYVSPCPRDHCNSMSFGDVNIRNSGCWMMLWVFIFVEAGVCARECWMNAGVGLLLCLTETIAYCLTGDFENLWEFCFTVCVFQCTGFLFLVSCGHLPPSTLENLKHWTP